MTKCQKPKAKPCAPRASKLPSSTTALNPCAPAPFVEPRALSPQEVEVEVLAGVLEGQSAAAAGRAAGVENGTQIMARPRVRSALIEALEARGVGEERLAQVIDQGLGAMQRMVIYRDGSAAPPAPDHDVRHKYLKTTLELRGELDRDAHAHEDSWEATIIAIRARRTQSGAQGV